MLMAIAIGLILSVVGLTLIVLFHVYIVGRAFRRGSEALESSTVSRNYLEKLPCYDYKSNDRTSNSPVDCAVCLDNFKDGEKCRMLPICRHIFHSHCVDAWLLRTPSCPICRTSADSSSHFSDSSIDLGGSHTTENSSSSSTDARTHLGDISIDVRETEDLRQSQEGSTQFNNARIVSRQSQIDSVGTQLNPNPDSESHL